MKWNKFQCKKKQISSVTMCVYDEKRISKRKSFVCVCVLKIYFIVVFFSFERRMKRKRLSVIFLSLIDTDNWKTAFNQRLIAMDLQYSYIRFNGSQLAMLLNEKCMHFEPGCLAGWLDGVICFVCALNPSYSE